jgi:TonB-dependent starch-binding outer membrane protein SusC
MLKTNLIFAISMFFLSGCANKGGHGISNEKHVEYIDNGYSETNSRSNIGSVASISDVGNNINLDDYLRRFAGVNVSGQGSSSTITIRGINSFSASIEPLFIMNGQTLGSFSEAYNLFNSNDIKNISVLKDAGSCAIYGSRGANGVIIIKLKNKK